MAGSDPRSNPMLNADKAWLPWCPDSGCTPAPPPPAPPPPPPTATCVFTQGMDYWPAHTQGRPSESPSDCCAACKQDSACKVAVWAGDRACYFKPENATERPKHGALSCRPK